jgi:hypothetical protein
MEKFGWTPNQIAEIPYTKIKELFMLMNQRRVAQEQKGEREVLEKGKIEGKQSGSFMR